MYNKKTLLQAMSELNKAKAPKKPKDIKVDPMGYWNPDNHGKPVRIPSNKITMEGVNKPLLGIANTGERQIMLPGADYTFPGADYVDEYPQMRKGGQRKKRKTKSIMGKNKLMEIGPLFKDYSKRIYDPNVNYFQDGGEYMELDLTDDEIEEYRKGGYIVEDISVPELNQAQKGQTVEISDPKELAYRNKMYNDSLDLYNYSNKQIADKTKRFGSDAVGIKKEYNKKKAAEFLKEQLKTYGDLAHDPKDKYGKLLTKLVKKSNISPIGLSINVEDYDYIFKKPAQKVVLKKENKPVQEVEPVENATYKSKSVKVNNTKYPEGYQPYSLYGKVLDPERYGYGESNEGKPIQLGQQMEAFGKELQMEKYKKSGKYPWVKQEGGGIKTHKSKDGTITNTITKANGDTVIQVKTKDGKYYEKVKPGLPQFIKDEFKKRADWENRSSGMAAPVDDFWTLPMGMTSAGVKTVSGIIPTIAKGLKSELAQTAKAGTKAFYNKSRIKSLPGSSWGNLLTSSGIVSGIGSYFDKDSDVRTSTKKAIENPTGSNIINAIGEHSNNALDFIGVGIGNNFSKVPKYINKLGKYAKIPASLKKSESRFVNIQDHIDDIVKNSSFKSEDDAVKFLVDYSKKNNMNINDVLHSYNTRGFGPANSNLIAAAEVLKNDLKPLVNPHLYHGTTSTRLNDILSSGLDNSLGTAINPGGVMADVLGGGYTTAAGDMGYAKTFAELSSNATSGKPVILRFKNVDKNNMGFIGRHPAVKGKNIEYSFDGGKTWSNESNFKRSDSPDTSHDFKKGGMVLELTPSEIDEYIKQGYTVEDVD
jgi:hypothetical protein